jgi:2-polyprenyl-6-methoxyphenol hydroxylase-like FAD-dependent oxidoreductase
MIGVLPTGRSFDDSKQSVAFFWSLPADQYAKWCSDGLAAWKCNIESIWPETAAIFDQISDAEQMSFAKYGHHTMRKPYSGRLVFIGDAAHSTSPQLGQGANMALLDSWALAMSLRENQQWPDALANYSSLRRWHVRFFQLASLLLTPFYQSDSRVLALLRDLLFDPTSRIPGLRRVVAGLVSGMLGKQLSRLQLDTGKLQAAMRDYYGSGSR